MSGKTAKAQRKEQKEKAADFEKRREAMLKELKVLSEKYRIDIGGSLQYTRQGIIPMVAFVDVKDQYENITDEAKKAELEKRAAMTNGQLKNKLKV
jgi:hypothetical protein